MEICILRDHDEDELSHYSNATTDIEYRYPWGFDEIWGIASRTDFDLRQHQEHSSENLAYLDAETGKKFLPYVIEPALGVERLFLAVLNEAYVEETLENNETRINLKLHPALAPYKVAVLPLIKKRHQEHAFEIQSMLAKRFMVTYDETGKIGKRYRRQDAIGTPFAVTVDDQSLEDQTYTLRHRDSMEQQRYTLDELIVYLEKALRF